MSDSQIPPSLCRSCLICHKSLSVEEINLNFLWHADCEQCIYCKERLAKTEDVSKCLASGSPIAHKVCQQRQSVWQMKNKILPATREYIQAINGQINYNDWKCVTPEDGDWENLSKLLVDLKEIAANVSMLIGLTKGQIQIKSDFEYAEHIVAEKKAKREIQATEEEKKIRLQAERVDPNLRDKRKAYEQLLATGWSQKDASEKIEEMWAKRKQGGTIQ